MACIFAGSADVVDEIAGNGEGTFAGSRGGGVDGVGTGDDGALFTWNVKLARISVKKCECLVTRWNPTFQIQISLEVGKTKYKSIFQLSSLKSLTFSDLFKLNTSTQIWL